MVRFKNRYILAEISNDIVQGVINEKVLLKSIKNWALEGMGEMFLAKISFSLQIKYYELSRIVIRVPRQHCNDLVACLFPISSLKIIRISGTILKIQNSILKQLRIEMKRQPTVQQVCKINMIDYA